MLRPVKQVTPSAETASVKANRPLRPAAIVLAVLFLDAAVSTSAWAASAPGGTQLWVKTFTGGEHFNVPKAVAFSPGGGRVFVVGTTGQGPTMNWVLRAYAADTGTLVWKRHLDGPAHGSDVPYGLVVAPGGRRLYVTGTVTSATGEDFETVAFRASDGSISWVREMDGAAHGDDEGRGVAVSPDGRSLFVTGYLTPVLGTTAYKTFALDAATGGRLWGAGLSGRGGDQATAIAASPDGSFVVVTGLLESPAGGEADLGTVAYSAMTGQKIWVAKYVQPTNDRGTGVVISPDSSRVFVSAASGGLVGANLTFAYQSGMPLWMNSAPTSDPGDWAKVALSPDGSRVFVAGPDGSNTYIGAVAHDSTTGATVWTNGYPGRAINAPTAIGVSPDGTSVFLAGSVGYGPPNYGDFGTVSFASTNGTVQWNNTWDDGGINDDWPLSLVVAPTGGELVVTGESWSSTTDAQFATVAYAA